MNDERTLSEAKADLNKAFNELKCVIYKEFKNSRFVIGFLKTINYVLKVFIEFATRNQ